MCCSRWLAAIEGVSPADGNQTSTIARTCYSGSNGPVVPLVTVERGRLPAVVPVNSLGQMGIQVTDVAVCGRVPVAGIGQVLMAGPNIVNKMVNIYLVGFCVYHRSYLPWSPVILLQLYRAKRFEAGRPGGSSG